MDLDPLELDAIEPLLLTEAEYARLQPVEVIVNIGRPAPRAPLIGGIVHDGVRSVAPKAAAPVVDDGTVRGEAELTMVMEAILQAHGFTAMMRATHRVQKKLAREYRSAADASGWIV